MTHIFSLAVALTSVLYVNSCLAEDAPVADPGSAEESGLTDNLQAGPADPLPAGTTDALARDWATRTSGAMANKPDRSARTAWVRMFPLTSVPSHDPYPKTTDIYNIQLQNSGGFSVYNNSSHALIGTTNDLKLNFRKSSFKVGKVTAPLAETWIVPHGNFPTTLRWNLTGVQLRGGFLLKRTGTSPQGIRMENADLQGDATVWSVINVVSVNDYLRGVVPSEAYSNWDNEALRTQAIAARTYALYEMAASRAAGMSYDLDPTTWYQSYRGVAFYGRGSRQWIPVERDNTDAAIRSTHSEVVTYQGEVVKAYFSSNSGGITCTATECLHKDSNPPYLQVVKDAPGVQDATAGTWNATFSTSAIRSKLASVGVKVAPKSSILGFAPLARGPSGRIWRLRVLLSNSTIDLDRDQTGTVMGLFGRVHSHLFHLDAPSKKGRQSVVGHGFGHGVGMSQMGAQLFAQQGWSAERILRHFYSQTQIKDLSALE